MSKMDVLFVVPRNVQDFQVGTVPDAIEPPAKARFMMAYLWRRGCSQALIDANLTEDTPEEIAKEVVAADPRFVMMPDYGYNPSASTQTMVSAREFAQAIRNLAPRLPIMMSGTHPAAIPAKTLMDEPIDYVCVGEGPITVHEMILAQRAGGAYSDIKKVRALVHWDKTAEDAVVVRNDPAPLIDLNAEPAIDGWKFMDPRRYVAHHWQAFYQGMDKRMPYANPYSREGCPFHCGFCNIQATFRDGDQLLRVQGLLKPGVHSFRSLQPELFVKEVTYLVETYGVKTFKIPDEMFMLGDHWKQIFRMIAEHYGDLLNFWSYARVDTFGPKDMNIFRAGGGRWAALGIEAANSTVRSGQGKKFNDDLIHRRVAAMHAAGIEGALNYIFGLQDDTTESMQETFQLACELNGTYGNFYCAQALPGANSLYRDAKKADYPLPERPGGPGWIGHAQYSWESEPCYLGHALTPAQILKFRDEAHVKYYRRPEYRERILRDPKFGPVAMKNIDDWIAQIEKLPRKLLGHPKP